ncbi:hypothetical protein BH24ACT3_BH24ACT3_11880 [soil metagenome]
MASQEVSTTPTLARRRFGALLVTVALMVGGAPPPASSAPAQTDALELKEQYDEVLAEEADLIRAHQALAEQRSALLIELQGLDTQIAEVSHQLEAAQGELVIAGDAADEAAAELARARRRLAVATDELNARAVSSYIHGGEGMRLETFLDEVEDNRSGRAESYAGAVVDHQQDIVEEFERARADNDRRTDAANDARTAARDQRDAVASMVRGLEAARTEQAELVVEADTAAFYQQNLITELIGRKAIIEGRILSQAADSDSIAVFLAQVQAGQPDWSATSVPMQQLPVQQARTSSEFGLRRHPILGTSRMHNGMDFGVGSGTPIFAPAPGRIVLAGVRGGYGNAVIIDHGFSLATLYGHQSRLAVSDGDVVEAGDLIGYVGSTGMSTGPHLHFETRLRGLPVNPRYFLSL